MSAPSTTLGVTDRYTLKEFTLERSAGVIGGRLMWCRGRKIVGYGNVVDLPKIFAIPKGADTIVLSAADFDDVKAWLG
jgi:hypothetical protein